MFNRNIFILHAAGELFSLHERLVDLMRDINFPLFAPRPADARQTLDLITRGFCYGSGVCAHFLKHLADQAVRLRGKRAKQMLLFNLHVAVIGRDVLGFLDRFQRFLRKFLSVH